MAFGRRRGRKAYRRGSDPAAFFSTTRTCGCADPRRARFDHRPCQRSRGGLPVRNVRAYRADVSLRYIVSIGRQRHVQRAVVRHHRGHLRRYAAHRATDRRAGLGRARRRADGAERRGRHRLLRAAGPRRHRGGAVGGDARAAPGRRGAVRDGGRASAFRSTTSPSTPRWRSPPCTTGPTRSPDCARCGGWPAGWWCSRTTAPKPAGCIGSGSPATTCPRWAASSSAGRR